MSTVHKIMHNPIHRLYAPASTGCMYSDKELLCNVSEPEKCEWENSVLQADYFKNQSTCQER